MTEVKKNKNYYFCKNVEQAVLDYCKTNDLKERTRLYTGFIQPAFSEMVDKIVFTYGFTHLPDSEIMREECKSWLITILDKFNVERGYKAFSYFSVVTKNWFIHKQKQHNIESKKLVSCEELSKELDTNACNCSEELKNSNKLREQKEFFVNFRKEVEDWLSLELRENEEKVVKAIIIIYDNLDDIDIFNKKAFYLYLREITGLNTKQIVVVLNKMRKKYRIFKKQWDRGDI